MAGGIIAGCIAVPFVIMAIFMINGRGAFLIAGYNTMSAEKRATYDEKALCKAVGWLLLILAALMLLFPLASYFEAMWLFLVSFVLFFIITIGFWIYANTGNRFRKDPDSIAPSAGLLRRPMSKGKRLAIIIGIVLSAQLCIGVGIMIYQGERDPIVSVHGDVISINALYGIDLNISTITEINLINKSMSELGVGTRTNGYSTTGQALKGNFSSASNGQRLLFVYSSSSPTIQIVRAIGKDIFISFRDSDVTEATYHMLSAAMP